jgi:hypothetical protein
MTDVKNEEVTNCIVQQKHEHKYGYELFQFLRVSNKSKDNCFKVKGVIYSVIIFL